MNGNGAHGATDITGDVDPVGLVAQLGAVLDRFGRVTLGSVSDGVLIGLVEGLQRVQTRVFAQKLRLIAELDERQAFRGDGHRSTADQMAQRLGMSGGQARAETDAAVALADLPKTGAALAAGRLGPEQVKAATRVAGDLPEEAVAGLDTLAAGMAAPEDGGLSADGVPVGVDGRDPGRMRRVLGEYQQIADPDGMADREAAARARRSLRLFPTADGMAGGMWQLDLVDGEKVRAVLEALARPRPGDTRSAAQRRADALVQLAEHALTGEPILIDDDPGDEAGGDRGGDGDAGPDPDGGDADAELGDHLGEDPAVSDAVGGCDGSGTGGHGGRARDGDVAGDDLDVRDPGDTRADAHSHDHSSDVPGGGHAGSSPRGAPEGSPDGPAEGSPDGAEVRGGRGSRDRGGRGDGRGRPGGNAKPKRKRGGKRKARRAYRAPARVLLILDATKTGGVGGAPPGRVDVDIDMRATRAYVDGQGAVSQATAEMLLCDAEIIPITVTMDGKTVDVGRADGNPTRRQRDAIIARDQGCIGCSAPASRCHVHHICYRRNGGATTICNCCLVCPDCHFRIHHLGWIVFRNPDGRLVLLAPNQQRPAPDAHGGTTAVAPEQPAQPVPPPGARLFDEVLA